MHHYNSFWMGSPGSNPEQKTFYKDPKLIVVFIFTLFLVVWMKRRWRGGAAAPSSIKLVAHFMTCNFSVATPHTPSASWNKNTFNNFLTTSGGGKNTFYKLFDMQDQVDCCFYFWATTTPTMYKEMWPSAHDNDNATDDATHIFWMQEEVHIQRQKILFINFSKSFWGGKKYFLWFFCHATPC